RYFGFLNDLDSAKQVQEVGRLAEFLAPDASNLSAVLSRTWNQRDLRLRFLEALAKIDEHIDGINLVQEGGTLQLYLEEKSLRNSIPATRLSDGTFRWLCLLAILLHPEPPPLICLEEPEAGLHPDAIVELAPLLRDASQRTQLIVTT